MPGAPSLRRPSGRVPPASRCRIPAALAARVLLSLAAATLAAPGGTAAQTIQRQFYVTVLNEDGFPVQGLRTDDFVVLEDGAPREVLFAGPATEPMQIDVLVDTSAAARPLMGDFRAALVGFTQDLHEAHDLALITFGGTRTVLVDSTNDLDRLTVGIESLFARPDTATYLLPALSNSTERFRQRTMLRPVVVVITTTGVDFSDQAPQPIVNGLRQTAAVMHAVVMRTSTVRMVFQDRFGLSEFPSWASRARDAALDLGPSQTGGRRVDMSTANGLDEILSRLAFELLNQYLVVYASSESLVPPSTVQIGVDSRRQVSVRAVPARLPSRAR